MGRGLCEWGQQTTAKMERKIENLKIWNDSRAFVNEIYKMMAQCCDYGFRDQIQRASVSIMNNIAEGFESGSDAAFVRYLQIAKGSCAEVKIKLHAHLYEISSGIYKLIQFLIKNKG